MTTPEARSGPLTKSSVSSLDADVDLMPPIPLPDPPLFDDAIRLRAFIEADSPAVAAAMEDGDISRWTATIPWPYSEADARAWIGSHALRRETGQGLDLAITEEGEALGAIGIDVDWGERYGQIGYWMSGTFRARGLATRAALLLSGWAREALELDSLQLFTIQGNVASERVAAKAGFEIVERLADQHLGTKRVSLSFWVRTATNP
jgi:ribosomal-protein-alanine N-acetyltransferase